MTKTVKLSTKFNTLLKWLAQLTAFVLVFLLASAYQERGMLEESGALQAPSFILPLLSEPEQALQTFSSSQLRGKPSVIYFFAPWCNVCRFSMPNLDDVYQAGDINAVAVALDYQSAQEVAGFVTKLGLSMPVVLGNQQISQQYKIKGYPTYYVLDTSGKIQERSVGYSTEIGLQYRLKTL